MLFQQITRRPNQAIWLIFALFIMMMAGFGVLSLCGCQTPPPIFQGTALQQVLKRGYLIVGVNYDSPPFGALVTTESGPQLNPGALPVEGFDVDLSREIARRLFRKQTKRKKNQPNPPVIFRQVVTDTRIAAVNSGAVDMVAATMTITPDRAKRVIFSTPYFTAHQAVLVMNKGPVRQLSDLKHRSIAFLNGSTSEANLRRLLPDAQLQGYPLPDQGIEALRQGQVDAMSDDDLILADFANHPKQKCLFRLLDEQLSDEPYALAFRHGKDTSLSKAVNRILQDMQQDGSLAKLRVQWIDRPHNPKTCL